jgi:hypothetical protein
MTSLIDPILGGKFLKSEFPAEKANDPKAMLTMSIHYKVTMKTFTFAFGFQSLTVDQVINPISQKQ